MMIFKFRYIKQSPEDSAAAATATPVVADPATPVVAADTAVPVVVDPAAVEYSDFELPEGMDLDAGLLEKAAPVFKELGLTKEQAQKLVSMRAAEIQEQNDTFEKTKADWLAAAKQDKDIGGDKFDESVGDARRFVDGFGGPELKSLLDSTGLGNNVSVIKAFARAGKLMKEDVPGGNAVSGDAKKDRVAVLYGE